MYVYVAITKKKSSFYEAKCKVSFGCYANILYVKIMLAENLQLPAVKLIFSTDGLGNSIDLNVNTIYFLVQKYTS